MPGERKSIEPLAARVAPGHDQELRHFVSESAWDQAEIEEVLWDKADVMLGGDKAFLIIDDTGLPKKGVESVGVAHQYCGALGKQVNCECLVSITLAKDDLLYKGRGEPSRPSDLKGRRHPARKATSRS